MLADGKGREQMDQAIQELTREFELDRQDLEDQVEEQENEVKHLKDEMERSQDSNNYIMQMKQ